MEIPQKKREPGRRVLLAYLLRLSLGDARLGLASWKLLFSAFVISVAMGML